MHNITSVIWKRHPALTNPTDPEVKAEEGGERQGFSQNPAFHEKKKEKRKRKEGEAEQRYFHWHGSKEALITGGFKPQICLFCLTLVYRHF